MNKDALFKHVTAMGHKATHDEPIPNCPQVSIHAPTWGATGAVSELVRTAPEQIYLQISDDESDHEEAFHADHGDEITWCADSVLDCEVKYIRSDLVTRHDSARSGGVSDATWLDPTGFSVAGILDEANNWTRRETGKQMLLNYAAALEHFAKGERHE